MSSQLWQNGGAAIRTADSYIGSPMYTVFDEHGPALLLVIVAVAVSPWIRRRLSATGYAQLDHPHRLAFWLLTLSSLAHAGLVLGHEPAWSSALYSVGAGLLGGAAIWMLGQNRHWRLVAGLALAASLFSYVVSMFAGTSPDQFGLAIKLAELVALTVLLTPRAKRTRARLVAANGLATFAFLLVGISGWLGAFSGSGGHHLGDVPSPGVLLPTGIDRQPTASERAAHDALVAAIADESAKYADLELAAAAGFDVEDISGTEYHAANEAFKRDDHHFDPARPENLIYGIGASGDAVLLGVMFEMPELRQAGPAPAGPLTVWHAHDHVCITVTGLGPLVSPWGGCPIGHVAMPMTNEMIHVWTVPGVDEPVGELEDWQRNEYLAAN